MSIQVKQINKSYGATQVLHDVSFECHNGETLVLLGPSGAGKSSLLRVLNLLAADFQGIPPTHIITAEYDPLRDEGERLYKLMLEQGVDASCQRYLGTIHGFFQLGAVSKSARRCLTAIAAEITR